MAGLASAQVRDVARRDSLLDAAKTDLALMQLRLEMAQAALADASKKVKVGAASTETLISAEAELRDLQARVSRLTLNIEEIKSSLQVARDELNAPLVDGRDFVKERIQLDLMAAQQQLIAAERTYSEVEPRVRAGVVTEVARVEAQLAVERARAGLAVLADRLALRREFVEKNTPADQLMNRLEASTLRQDTRVAQAALALAQMRLKRLEDMHTAGAVADVEVLRAQLEVKERELELQRAAAQLRRLDRAPTGGKP
jgi:outer membrane protein TolC